MEDVKQNYSRSEWSNLSIQHRITAMNQMLDKVEESGDVDVLDAESTFDEATSLEEEEPPKRMSVIDMWRKKGAPASEKEESVTPVKSEKKKEEEKKEDYPQTEENAFLPEQPIRETIQNPSPPVVAKPITPRASPRSSPRASPKRASPRFQPLDVSSEPADLTIVPSKDDRSVVSEVSRTSKSKLFSLIDKPLPSEVSAPASPKPTAAESPKRSSVVDMWNSKKQDPKFENDSDDEELKSTASNKAPSVVIRWSQLMEKNQEDDESEPSKFSFDRTFDSSKNQSDTPVFQSRPPVVSTPVRPSSATTPSRTMESISPFPSPKFPPGKVTTPSFPKPVSTPSSSPKMIRPKMTSTPDHKPVQSSSPTFVPKTVPSPKFVPNTVPSPKLPAARLPTPKRNKMAELWEKRIQGQDDGASTPVTVEATVTSETADRTRYGERELKTPLPVDSDLTDEGKDRNQSPKLTISTQADSSEVVYGSSSPRARHRKPSSGDLNFVESRGTIIVPESPKPKELAKALNERIKKSSGVSAPSPIGSIASVNIVKSEDKAIMPGVASKKATHETAKVEVEERQEEDDLTLPALPSDSVEPELASDSIDKTGTKQARNDSRHAKINRLGKKFAILKGVASASSLDSSANKSNGSEPKNFESDDKEVVPQVSAKLPTPARISTKATEDKAKVNASSNVIKTDGSAFDSVPVRRKSEARQHFLQLGLRHKAPRAGTPSGVKAEDKVATSAPESNATAEFARESKNASIEQPVSNAAEFARNQESLVLKKKRLEDQKRRLKTCLSDDPDEVSMVEQTEIIEEKPNKLHGQTAVEQGKDSSAKRQANFADFSNFDPTPESDWVPFPKETSEAALKRVSSDNGGDDAGFTFLDGQSTFSGFSGISRNSSNVSGSSLAQRAVRRMRKNKQPTSPPRGKAAEDLSRGISYRQSNPVNSAALSRRAMEVNKEREAVAPRKDDVMYNRYRTDERYAESSSRLTGALDSRMSIQKTQSNETSLHTREYSEEDESTVETYTTMSASSYHSDSRGRKPRKSGLASEEFLAENSRNFDAFGRACGSVTLSELAKDWASEMELGARNVQSFALGFIKPLSVYTGGKISSSTSSSSKRLAASSQRPDDQAPFDEDDEDTAIEVEFMDSEDDPGKDLGVCSAVDKVLDSSACQHPYFDDTPAGQPSFEERAATKRRAKRVK